MCITATNSQAGEEPGLGQGGGTIWDPSQDDSQGKKTRGRSGDKSHVLIFGGPLGWRQQRWLVWWSRAQQGPLGVATRRQLSELSNRVIHGVGAPHPLGDAVRAAWPRARVWEKGFPPSGL